MDPRARDYQAALNDVFRPDDAAPGPAHRAAAALGVRAILTTNYDQLFERLHETPPRQPYTWKEADRALGDLRAGRRVLFKIHGTVERHETVVMSSAEYDAARTDASYQAVLSYLLQDHAFLFLGYGMNDPLDLDLAFRANAAAFKAAAQKHYALLRSPSDADRDRLDREYNVQVIPYAEHAEVPAILERLAAETAPGEPAAVAVGAPAATSPVVATAAPPAPPVAPAPAALIPVPTLGSLRKLLREVLRSDTDLDAFCFDHFGRTHARFSAGMERDQKLTLLLQYEDLATVLARLRDHDAEAVARHESLLRYA